MSHANQIRHSDASDSVRIKFRSGPLAVRAALAHILSELEPLGIEQGELGTIEIVLAEALSNIVEHAYPEDGPSGPIDIDCRADGDVLHVRIIDSGHPMPGEVVPEGTEANVDADLLDLPEGGFGWFLIRELARNVSYSRNLGHNRLKLTFDL